MIAIEVTIAMHGEATHCFGSRFAWTFAVRMQRLVGWSVCKDCHPKEALPRNGVYPKMVVLIGLPTHIFHLFWKG